MSRLVWDAVGERLYETGTDHGVLYPTNDDGTYGTGVNWNGLTAVTETPEGGEPEDQYADNIKYLSLMSAETFGGTIEAFNYPTEFEECDGTKSFVGGIAVGQQARKSFGFSYRTVIGNDVKGNDFGYKLHLVYGAKVSPSERSYATINDSPEAITFSWEFKTTPVPFKKYKDLKPTAILTIDSSKLDVTGKAKLVELENKLYGVDADPEHSIEASDPMLPTPDQVLELFGVTVAAG